MALDVDSEDIISNKYTVSDPTDHTLLNADHIMTLVRGILNGEYRIKPMRVFATFADMKAVTGESFEHAGCLDNPDQEYKWSASQNDWIPIP